MLPTLFNLALAAISLCAALAFLTATYVRHTGASLFGYSPGQIAHVGTTFGLMLALFTIASLAPQSLVSLVVLFGLAAALYTAAFARQERIRTSFLSYIASTVSTTGLAFALIYHASQSQMLLVVACAVAFIASLIVLVKVALMLPLTPVGHKA